MIGILSHKWYASAWGDWGPEGFGRIKDYTRYGNTPRDPTRALQFGVNMIIFALTQEGSITHRLVESIQ